MTTHRLFTDGELAFGSQKLDTNWSWHYFNIQCLQSNRYWFFHCEFSLAYSVGSIVMEFSNFSQNTEDSRMVSQMVSNKDSLSILR